jgi:MFS family permease
MMDAAVAAPSPARSLWRNRDFNVVWAGQTLSVLGDAFASLAMPLLVLGLTGSVAKMGLVTGAYGVGGFLGTLFAGVIVDRARTQWVMVTVDVCRTAAYVAVPLQVLWTGQVTLWVVIVSLGLAGTLSMVFDVAYNAALPALVAPEELTLANGRVQATHAAAFVLGPWLAGLLCARVGPSNALLVDAGSFLLSAISLGLVRFRSAPVTPQVSGGRADAILAGARFLRRSRLLGTVTLLAGAMLLLDASVPDLFVFHLKQRLHVPETDVGLTFGIAGVGAVVGGLVAPAFSRRLGFGPSYLCAIAGEGLALFVGAGTTTMGGLLPVAVLYSFAKSLQSVMSLSLRLSLTPGPLRGRVAAAFWTLLSITGPLGAALATAIAARVGLPLVLRGMGVGIGLLFVIGLFGPARHRRAEGTP